MPPKKAAATASATTAPKRSARSAAAQKSAEPAAKAAAPTKKTTTATTKAAGVKKAAPTKKAAPAKKVAAAPKKAAATKKSPPIIPIVESDKENQVAKTNKRKREEDEEEEAAGDEVAEKVIRPAAKKVTAPKPKRQARELKAINEPPRQVMDIFVFGEGTAGELGLGSVRVDGKKPIDVKRPRLNSNLKGVVQVACGGMHVAALTDDNKILTWGVNDQGALGRDTTWDGGVRDVDDEEDDDEDDDDTGMNPKESTPSEVDMSDVPENTVWVQIVASDSATFALTTTGQVYGWGTFRVCLIFNSICC